MRQSCVNRAWSWDLGPTVARTVKEPLAMEVGA